MTVEKCAEKLKNGELIPLGCLGHLSAIRFVTKDSIESLSTGSARVRAYRFKLIYHPSKELKSALR